MGYFDDWFGPDYFEDWFDTTEPASPSGNGGVSKARVLGTRAPRPQVPPWRHIEGSAGMMLQEVRRFLNEVQDRSHVWGNHVSVTFAAPNVSVRVDTGLGGPATGYHVVGSNTAMKVFDGTPTTGDPTPERGIIWLQSDAAGTAKLFIY